ncbi:probable 2-oxoglutarate-dependent dioxygenase AOP1 [Coffea eugenioides]|uniref:probable 2-oxoglutarate-dependent dioxygenase AOP1 n=1 Tax=Coffea eugenioides TaxID=49369 RepID=UPI000F60F9F4|nr:probable 2-oxoglutarate-dependent dioxygenase AOP1 [Coffea eugenioides]
MGSQSQANLPIVYFTRETLKPGTSSWLSTCKKVRDALEKHSCFLVQYERIPSELISSIFLQLGELFDLPTETKVQNITTTDGLFGYFGQQPTNPTYEGMGIEDVNNPEAVLKFTNLMWPSGNDSFCELMESYKNHVSDLEKLVMRTIFESFGVEKLYSSHDESCNRMLRFNKHRPPQMNENLGGVPEHTDPTFVTIIQRNQFSSLEVKSKEDGSWIAVDFPPSSFLVMAGDCLVAWSNGRVHSTVHRIRMRPGETRFSTALFSYHNGMVHVPEELVDDEHPLQFKPFDQMGFFRFTFAYYPLSDESKIKAYCGI